MARPTSLRPPVDAPAPALLAVDLGLRTGLAAFARDGRALWARSQNLGTRTRLRAAAGAVLDALPGVERVVLEGGGDLARLWAASPAAPRPRRARRRCRHVAAGPAAAPRPALGADAKAAADGLARAVLAWSGAPAPEGPLRHDAAEAVAVGLWAVLDAGWLDPSPVRDPEPLTRRSTLPRFPAAMFEIEYDFACPYCAAPITMLLDPTVAGAALRRGLRGVLQPHRDRLRASRTTRSSASRPAASSSDRAGRSSALASGSVTTNVAPPPGVSRGSSGPRGPR